MKEPYIGSVRFFRHLIVGVCIAAIIIPTITSIILGFLLFGADSDSQSQWAPVARQGVENDVVYGELENVETVPEPEETECVSGNGKLPQREECLPEITFDVDTDDWKYLVVSQDTPIPNDFSVELASVSSGQKVDIRIVEPLKKMVADAKKAGHSLIICSGYRSAARQWELFQNSMDRYTGNGASYHDAFSWTRISIQLPGESEHELGLSVDIVGKGHQSLDSAQAETKEAAWLKENCAEYGFILRYPEDKQELTKIGFESWHFRYVGVEAASYIMENNLCLEEFVELVKAGQKTGETR